MSSYLVCFLLPKGKEPITVQCLADTASFRGKLLLLHQGDRLAAAFRAEDVLYFYSDTGSWHFSARTEAPKETNPKIVLEEATLERADLSKWPSRPT